MSAGKIQTDPRYEFETAKGATAAGLRLPQKSYARRKITKGHKCVSALIGVRIELQGRRGNDT